MKEIKLNEDIQNHFLWTDVPFSRAQAFIDLLLRAEDEDGQKYVFGILQSYEKGEGITTLRELGRAWGWSSSKVKKFLLDLDDNQLIEVEFNNKMTIFKIIDLDRYMIGEELKQ